MVTSSWRGIQLSTW